MDHFDRLHEALMRSTMMQTGACEDISDGEMLDQGEYETQIMLQLPNSETVPRTSMERLPHSRCVKTRRNHLCNQTRATRCIPEEHMWSEFDGVSEMYELDSLHSPRPNNI